jgi:hypothetical protein
VSRLSPACMHFGQTRSGKGRRGGCSRRGLEPSLALAKPPHVSSIDTISSGTVTRAAARVTILLCRPCGASNPRGASVVLSHNTRRAAPPTPPVSPCGPRTAENQVGLGLPRMWSLLRSQAQCVNLGWLIHRTLTSVEVKTAPGRLELERCREAIRPSHRSQRVSPFTQAVKVSRRQHTRGNQGGGVKKTGDMWLKTMMDGCAAGVCMMC